MQESVQTVAFLCQIICSGQYLLALGHFVSGIQSLVPGTSPVPSGQLQPNGAQIKVMLHLSCSFPQTGGQFGCTPCGNHTCPFPSHFWGHVLGWTHSRVSDIWAVPSGHWQPNGDFLYWEHIFSGFPFEHTSTQDWNSASDRHTSPLPEHFLGHWARGTHSLVPGIWAVPFGHWQPDGVWSYFVHLTSGFPLIQSGTQPWNSPSGSHTSPIPEHFLAERKK